VVKHSDETRKMRPKAKAMKGQPETRNTIAYTRNLRSIVEYRPYIKALDRPTYTYMHIRKH
jgi:hypothetical protein